jgi:hypothetical protein
MLTEQARNRNRIYLVTGYKWLVLLNSDSIKDRKFLHQLNDCQLLRKEPVPLHEEVRQRIN